MITIVSFGYKHGPVPECDAEVDCRVLRNPYNVPELKVLNGRDTKVREYLIKDPKWAELVTKAETAVEMGCKSLAVGCYGGTHRAPAIAEQVADDLRKLGLEVQVEHRALEAA